MRALFKILSGLLLVTAAYCQKGNYFLHNYLPAQYNAADQNRCVVQDLYGRIFVANNDGVLINSGAGWEKMDPYFPFLCLSLAKDESEQMFVAGDGNFGKIVQNKNGGYKFETLMNLLPAAEQQELGRFWAIIPLKGHVYFCSNEKIIDYDYKTLKVIKAGEEGFHTFYRINNTLVLREKGAGLKFLSINNQLGFFKGGEQFADNTNPVRGIIKGHDDVYYIITPKKVFAFAFNTQVPELSKIKEISTPVNEWLSSQNVYCSANIGKDYFAFGSVAGGLLITDKQFRPVKYINSTNGLQDDGVNYIYNDSEGHIWLALAKGISFIEFNSPLTLFTKADGIKGTIEACTFFQNTAYLATDKGVLKYNPATLKYESTNLTEAAWCLANSGGKLLAGTRSGLYVLENGKFNLVYETPSALHCIFAPLEKNVIYLGTESGYAKGFFENKKFLPLKESFEMNADIRTMAVGADSSIFFASTENGIFVQKPGEDTVTNLAGATILTNLKEGYLFNCKGEVLLGTESGISKISKVNGTYSVALHPSFDMLNGRQIVIRAATIHNQVWATIKLKNDITASERLVCLEKINDQFVEKPLQLSRITESNVKSFCYNDSLVYIGTNNGLYCYDLTLNKHNVFLNTFVNSFLCGKDSSQFYYNISPRTVLPEISLKYANNSIVIKLGASDYIDHNELLFSYYLKGRDSGYGPFTNKNEITLERLYEGDYVFFVKSKNILGTEGQEIKIAFTVLPPWYRTYWAYALYALAVLGFVYLIIKLNVKRLREQNIKLENIITERTKEIHQQKLEIEHKNQEITDSINYAKGIQDSILPGINEIRKAWSDLFVFFQPKDIVSGDFYWFKQLSNEEFLIACCDCTGHGVPGGFMSMICSDKLHDAAKQTTDPGRILFLANNSIKETLRQQNEGKSKDGMEICLLHVNTKTRKVKFAGANRPLWVYHQDTKGLSEIKPNKASIASFTEFNYQYDTHETQLNAGDCLYASTDGYADQFGGQAGKKYMSKNLKSMLIQLSGEPMEQVGKKLESEIKTWMSRYEQVDDLLVIGVKL